MLFKIPPPSLPSPAIAVIIPAYNREKYIGECLDSVLAQTFQSFEVIVVDDASTDKTAEIVESYLEKFNGRLKLIKSEKNSGHPGEPRNKAISLSCSEYVYCLDSDDIILENALEEMYKAAKDFKADVVYCEKYYMSEGAGQEFKDKMRVADSRLQKPPFVDKPTLETEDLAERLKKFLDGNHWMSPALRLVKRNFLLEHDIKFSEIVGSEDNIWSAKIFFCAKKFLRIPNLCFVRRIHEDGISFKKYDTPDHVERWLDAAIRSLKDLDNFLKKIPFFRENPAQSFEIINNALKSGFYNALRSCENETAFNVYSIVQKKFGDSLGEQDVLVSCLCSFINEQKKSAQDFKNQIAAREAELKKIQDAQKAELKKLKDAQEAELKKLKNEQELEIEKLKAKIESITPLPPLPMATPAISVIIPMYNAEKYIGECLDSLVSQTLQNFEVIIVDDCSTDGGVAFAESYLSKFNGRLKVTKTEKNSGGGALPRNIGLNLARGEFVLFVDADDFLLETALETLYRAAKEFNAEVVYYSTYYRLPKPDEVILYQDALNRVLVESGQEDKPTLTVDDPKKILTQLFDVENIGEGNFTALFTKFVRRDFLLENKISFPLLTIAEDAIWTVEIYCRAKRFLRISTPLYFYRVHNAESVTRSNRKPAAQISTWFLAFTKWIAALQKLKEQHAILNETNIYSYARLKKSIDWYLSRMAAAQQELTSQEIYELLRKEFADENDLINVVIPLFFSQIDAKQKELAEKIKMINKVAPYVTGRIDIKLQSTAGYFKIDSVSDKSASVQKPAWINKNGVGYVINSHAGKLEFVAKSTVNGKIALSLRGKDVRDPEDNTKRIPYWIDYTKLVVGGKTIFDKLTPAWHDKPYKHTIDAKAGEEIKIQVEWLPHRSDV